MQTQIIMNKNELGLGDSVQTHQDGLSNQISSCQLRNSFSSSRIQRSDQSTITDQMICNCACDTIPKLKQKAHKSFMQVIQIQNLYKEQIYELKNFYEESLKNKDKKFKIKQQVLNQKCKQLEYQVEKIKQYYRRERPYEIETNIQSPFESDSIDGIKAANLVQDNNQSIITIRQLIQTPNLKDTARRLQTNVYAMVDRLKQHQNRGDNQLVFNDAETDTAKINDQYYHIIQNLESQISKIFQFINTMIENTVQAHQKYNQLVLISNQYQNRYNKLYSIHQSGLKQSKFMAQHIKKIAQDKIRLQKKGNQFERTIKSQEQNIKFLKKLLHQKQIIKSHDGSKKDIDCMTSYHSKPKQQIESQLNKGLSLLSTKIQRRNNMMTRSAQNNLGDKILPRSLNFKKKIGQPQKSNQKL